MGCKCLSFLPPSELASSTVSVHWAGATLPLGRGPGQQQEANILGVMALRVFLHLTRSVELQVDKSCELEKHTLQVAMREQTWKHCKVILGDASHHTCSMPPSF